jgi:alpha-beta hydrolase superfamily lysophospholipase
LAGVVPLGTGVLRARPHPARSYDDAVARARRIVAADDSVVADGGASLLLTHKRATPRAIVLLHGFTNSPRQFADLADSLFKDGDNVFVPRLPRHAVRGNSVADLAGLTAAELCRAADNAVDIAAGLGDSVIVVGLSIGGTLALWSAEQRSEVRRAVVIAPPLEVATVPSILERPMVNIGGHVPNVTRRAAADSARPDRLPGFATHALARLIRLGMAVRGDAERASPLSPDVSFLANAHDRTVKGAAIEDVARTWHRRGAPGMAYEIPDSLGLPHNVLDPVGDFPHVGLIKPLLVALAHGERIPAWLHAMR